MGRFCAASRPPQGCEGAVGINWDLMAKLNMQDTKKSEIYMKRYHIKTTPPHIALSYF